MGALTGDDDGLRPDRDPTPDGPLSVNTPWGRLPIPDDISELADEAADVRRGLRRSRWRHRLWRLLAADDDPRGPGIIGPLLVMALAMTIGLGSLFGGFWPHRSNDLASGATRVHDVPERLPELILADPHGRQVQLAVFRPSVIISVARCICADLIAQAAAMTRRKGIPLIVVDQPTAADLPPSVPRDVPGRIVCVADPEDKLSRTVASLRETRRGTAMVLLVAGDGSLTQVLADVRSAHEFAPGLDRLG
ncbi:MAG TPA: hypothetical protein VHJ83_08965 [Micromonosporaceae bacterium]|jgi:hypothetical protein|nr:hypothetical protein [Micromonosporaceae bacterium]